MINYDELLAPAAKSMRPSGIRKFFDLAADMPHCISLGVGEPDFKTPWSVRDAGIRSLELGRTKYTANAGLKELRSEICNYLARRFELHYKEENILVTVGGSEAIDLTIRALVQPGDEVLVTLYIDKSRRLCASMKKLYDLMRTDSPYKKGDTVNGRIYEFGHDFGTFVAVDDCYSAMISAHEDCSHLQIGDVIEAKVTGVKPDGKLDITMREKAYLQMDADAEKVMEVIEEFAGVLPFTDKASPEVIMRETGLSKNAFKRAVGRLYKERRIEITERAIRKL